MPTKRVVAWKKRYGSDFILELNRFSSSFKDDVVSGSYMPAAG